MKALSRYNDKCHLTACSAARAFNTRLDKDATILSVNHTESSFILQTDQSDTISGRRILDNIDWKVVKNWLGFCKGNHSKYCARSETSLVSNLRVIDCETRQIITAEDPNMKYLTLSYVWGKSNNEPITGTGLPTKLPLTIEHAIEVVKSLKYRYLWVDRYCVPQDESPEKHGLIRDMGLIYENSELTLIAAIGEDPSHGLPGVGLTFRKSPDFVQVGLPSMAIVSLRDEGVEKSEWNTRGWTYQEALLSRRKLVFLEQGLRFQCGAMHCVEELSVPLPAFHTKALHQFRADVIIPMLFPSHGVGKSPFDIYDRIHEYSKREFTYDNDCIDAFQGILERFAKMVQKVEHFHGVPLFSPTSFKPRMEDITHRLLFGLNWTIKGPAIRRRGFPSWTWAGWKLAESSSFQLMETMLAIGWPSRGAKLAVCFMLTDISIEFIDGIILPWRQSHEEILRKCKNGCPPSCLRLVGLVFNLTFSKKGDFHDAEEFTKGRIFEEYRIFPDIQAPEKTKHIKTLCMISGHKNRSLHGLILIKLKGKQIYNRIGAFKMFGPWQWPNNTSILSEMETLENIRLRKELVRIG